MRTNLTAILISILACATIISSEYSAAADLSAAKSFAQSALPTNAAYVVVNSLQQAEKVATNHTLQYIVVSDGTHHAVFEKIIVNDVNAKNRQTGEQQRQYCAMDGAG